MKKLKIVARLNIGLTLIELMITLALLSILTTIGIPSFQTLVAQNRAASVANELQTTMQFARSAAMTRSQTVFVYPVNEDWNQGWIVEYKNPDLIIRERDVLSSSIDITGPAVVRFNPRGSLDLNGQPVSDFQFNVAINIGIGATRKICILLSGSTIVDGDICI